MTDLTREQIEALLDGTTPGDWSVATDPCHYDTASDVVCGKNLHASVGGEAGWREQEANTRIMAAAPDLARQLLATMDALAEAQAAQAGVCETLAARCDEHARHEVGREAGMLKAHAAYFRSIADPTGVKLLAALRAERDRMNQWRETAIVERDTYSQERDEALAQLAEAKKREAGLVALIRWAHETLWELNPNNYDHDEVCKVNDAAVEVILGLAPVIGETHGYSAEWWSARTGKMRLETGMENIARDMAEGRFPERSEPKMVSDTAALSTAPTGVESNDWRSRGTKTEDGYNG
jgi:hypothetical protein